MKNLSEFKGEQALDLMAEMLDPFTEIFADPALKALASNGKKIDIAKKILKDHKRSVITILALMEEEDPETYEPTLAEIPVKVIQILNDPAFQSFFTSQGQKVVKASFGSATESTEE